MDILTSLHKSLQPSWTSPILCRNLSNANNQNASSHLLQGILSSFSNYDNKVKLRILLSFLAVKPEVISNNAILIKKILEQASDEMKYDSWVTSIAGLVHRHLFHSTSIGSDPIERSLLNKFDEIVKSLTHHIHHPNQNNNQSQDEGTVETLFLDLKGDDISFFQPMETSYTSIYTSSIDNGDSSHSNDIHSTNPSSNQRKLHFRYSVTIPNFLEREKKRGKERQGTKGTKRTFALADSIRSVPSDHRMFGSSNSSAVSSRISLLAKNKLSESSSKSHDHNQLSLLLSPSQRKSVQIVDLQTVKQIQQENIIAKKPLNTIIETTASSASSSNVVADNQPSKKKVKVDNQQVGQPIAPSTSSSTSSSSTSSSSTSSSLPAAATTTTTSTPATTTTYETNTMKPLDLHTLFAESPLLTEQEKETIQKFFSADGPKLFPPGTTEMKFNLQRNEKMSPTGEIVVETIRLRLICTPHQNWQKSLSKKYKTVENDQTA